MGKVSQVVYSEFERRFVKAGEELFTYEIDLSERNLRPGLLLRAGGRGFPPATQSMAPGYFRR